MIYRDILNYTTIIMKNKPKNYFKNANNIFDNLDNNNFESNILITQIQKILITMNLKIIMEF